MWAWGCISAANSRVTHLPWAGMSLASMPYPLCDDEIIFIPWHWIWSGCSDVLALQPSAEEAPEPLGGLFSWLAASFSSEDHLSFLVVASEQSWEDNLSSSQPNTHVGDETSSRAKARAGHLRQLAGCKGKMQQSETKRCFFCPDMKSQRYWSAQDKIHHPFKYGYLQHLIWALNYRSVCESTQN